eukprot:SAG31_NODE_34716_length_330_cov_0.675325_2_plen_24_part_01
MKPSRTAGYCKRQLHAWIRGMQLR